MSEKKIYTEAAGRKLIKEFACSRCWGSLELKPADEPGLVEIMCRNAKTGSCSGLVGFTKLSVIQAIKSSDFADYIEISDAYPELDPSSDAPVQWWE